MSCLLLNMVTVTLRLKIKDVTPGCAFTVHIPGHFLKLCQMHISLSA